MRTLQKNAKLTMDGFMSFVIWTSVAAVGALLCTLLGRLLWAAARSVYLSLQG